MNQVIEIVSDGHEHKKSIYTLQKKLSILDDKVIKPMIEIRKSPYGKRKIQKLIIQESEQSQQEISLAPPQLLKILKQQKSKLKSNLYEQIHRLKKMCENKVYTAQFENNIAVLEEYYLKQGLFKSKNSTVELFMQKLLIDSLQNRQNHIFQEIQNNKIVVYKKRELVKDDLEQLNKLDQARLIKIKEGQLKSKIDILNSHMEQIKYYSEGSFQKVEKVKLNTDRENKLIENLDFRSFKLSSPKTKEATQQVRKLNQKRKQKIKRKKEEQQNKFEQQARQVQQDEFNKKLIQKEKKQQIRKKIEQKRRQREEYEKKRLKKQAEVERMLEQYVRSKPIYKRNQQRFIQQYVKPRQENYMIQIMRIKEFHKPLNMEQLEDHQKNYFDLKDELKKKRDEQMKNILDQRKRKRLKLYKSNYYKSVSQRITENQKSIIKEKKQKVKQFGKILKQKFIPKINESKKNQLLLLIAKTDRRNKKVKRRKNYSDSTSINEYEELKEKDYRRQGDKFLQFSRRIAQRYLNKKNQLKMVESVEIPETQPLQELEEISKRRLQQRSLQQLQIKKHNVKVLNNWKQILNNSKLNSGEKAQNIILRSMLLDQKVDNKQKVIRNMNFLDPEMEIAMKSQLDEHYLSSIKAKVAVLHLTSNQKIFDKRVSDLKHNQI